MSGKTFRWLLMLVVALVAAPLVWTQPVSAQNATWTAQYYNNQVLSGTPVLVRQEGALSFNWGTGSPASEVNADGFSARFATDVVLPAGTYRFFVQADDGVKLFVNFPFQPQIDTYDAPRVGQLLTADVTIPGGSTHIQLDYREVTGDAYVFLTWQNAAGNPTNPNFPVPQQPQTVSLGGWTAQYYNNVALSGAPALIRGEGTPANNWGPGSPGPSVSADNFSARWTTTTVLPAGSYRITVRADDGVRVWVDGVLYIDRLTGFTGQQFTADMVLGAGTHTFMIEFIEYGGNAYLEFAFTRTDVPAPPVVVNPPVNPPAATGAVATVTTGRLNVRQTPDPIGGVVLTRISRGDVYNVVAQYNTGAYGTWYQLNVNGTVGWVSGSYVNVANAQSVPVSSPTSPAPAQGIYSGISRGEVNIRSGPGTQFQVLGRIPRENITVQIVGRNANNTWWRISYEGITGWVSAQWVRIQDNADLNRLPVQG